MEKLSDLPNIGNSLEQKLIEAEIKNPQQLVELGSENAFLRLSYIDESSCFNMLWEFDEKGSLILERE